MSPLYFTVYFEDGLVNFQGWGICCSRWALFCTTSVKRSSMHTYLRTAFLWHNFSVQVFAHAFVAYAHFLYTCKLYKVVFKTW